CVRDSSGSGFDFW
nr:immunoglobulin heavy chain junction region [Macaca mulatta]MOX66428.1 immunoglobulin heavy chain junction region [Macaca mulatta]MOX67572.1 immunoglobulin heavy chain junction region [Macaca mulatta]MOX67884.1 immunoglobulin heavy chain junction region [Macaca mulatta]MOX68186.1 immunoglobulin heavy chain junction region [Macaca mulatta]